MHLAHLMGAKNFILVGHDCGTLNASLNINSYNSRDDGSVDSWGNNGKEYKNWLKQIEK